MVLRDRCRVTITQKTRTGKELIVTGNPIFDDHGHISRIVINSRDISELINLKHKLEEVELLAENCYKVVRSLQRHKMADGKIIAAGHEMKRIIDLADKVTPVGSTVLITGESGVGKGLAAARIHKHSRRAAAPFTPINCGAIPAALLESELFGYKRGAFTGADKEGKRGLIEVSHGGTVFLDEVPELPLNVQVKLLNLIQEKKYYRVGGNRQVQADVRHRLRPVPPAGSARRTGAATHHYGLPQVPEYLRSGAGPGREPVHRGQENGPLPSGDGSGVAGR